MQTPIQNTKGQLSSLEEYTNLHDLSLVKDPTSFTNNEPYQFEDRNLQHKITKDSVMTNPNKIQAQLIELKEELDEIQRELGWAEKQRQQQLIIRKLELQKRAFQASELVEQLYKERVQFKRKIKHIVLKNKLKQRNIFQRNQINVIVSQRSRIDQKKLELENRLRGIHQKSMNRIEKMESFEKEYCNRIKSMINRNTNIHSRISRQHLDGDLSTERQQLKNSPNWDLIRKHQKSYIRLAQHYALQNDSLIHEEWNDNNFESRAKSNPYLNRIAYKIPKKKQKIQTAGAHLLEETTVNFKKTAQQTVKNSTKKLGLLDFVPQIRKDLRLGLRKLAHRLSNQTQAQSINSVSNKTILQTIKKLDVVVQKKTVFEKTRSKTNIQEEVVIESDLITSRYLRNINHRLSLLNNSQLGSPSLAK